MLFAHKNVNVIKVHQKVNQSLNMLLNTKIPNSPSSNLPKIFLTDQETLPFTSTAITKHEMFSKEIVIFGQIDSYFTTPVDGVNAPDFAGLQCYCLVAPTPRNICLICDELRKPHFPSYNLYFTSRFDPSVLEELSTNDIYCLVNDIQEFFLNYSPLQDKLFSFDMPNILDLRNNLQRSSQIDQIARKLIGVFQTLDKKAIVRYQASSPVSKAVAEHFQTLYQAHNDLFNKSSQDFTTVIIVDRLEDPLFPVFKMLNMISLLAEYYPFKSNIFEINDTIKPLFVMLNPQEDKNFDDFYCKYPYVCSCVFDKCKDFNSNQNLQMIEQNAQNQYAITKFDALVNLVDKYIMPNDIKKVKREILIQSSQFSKTDLPKTLTSHERGLLTDNDIDNQDFFASLTFSSKIDVLRSALIIAAKNPNEPQIAKNFLTTACSEFTFTQREINYIDTIIRLCKNKPNVVQSQIYQIAKQLSGGKNKLSTINYPFIGEQSNSSSYIIFVVGGTTYSECTLIQQFQDVVLGGTSIHNLQSYLTNEIDPITE